MEQKKKIKKEDVINWQHDPPLNQAQQLEQYQLWCQPPHTMLYRHKATLCIRYLYSHPMFSTLLGLLNPWKWKDYIPLNVMNHSAIHNVSYCRGSESSVPQMWKPIWKTPTYIIYIYIWRCITKFEMLKNLYLKIKKYVLFWILQARKLQYVESGLL